MWPRAGRIGASSRTCCAVEFFGYRNKPERHQAGTTPTPVFLEAQHVLEDLDALEAQRDPLLPSDPQKRKAVPLYSGLAKYFPDALAAVAELSSIGNEQHNPGEPLHWDRAKSTDELDAAMRHLFEAGTIDSDGTRHSTKLAWRALANLQRELEQPVANAAVPAQVNTQQALSTSAPDDFCLIHQRYDFCNHDAKRAPLAAVPAITCLWNDPACSCLEIKKNKGGKP